VVAIVSAYDDRGLQSDLAAYDRRFKLPSCTTKNGCIRKLNESGQAGSLPGTDPTGGQWITESALGTEIVHGICQSCRIRLVEARSASESDFSQAVAAAGRAGASVIVTTFTPGETVQDPSFAADFSTGHAAVVSAVGDPAAGKYGYTGALNFPAALPSVLAVGGTQLRVTASGHRLSESAWEGTVSGCSQYEPAPAWQQRVRAASDCGSMRADADISAVAAPGAIVHIGGIDQSGGPWYVAQGTSLAAPVIGAVIGLAGSAGHGEAQMLYARQQSDPSSLHDITTGVSAPGCLTAICKAVPGWDGPTGLGSPDGLAAFLPGGPALSSGHPRISISAPRDRISVSRAGTVTLRLANANPFAISGTLLIRATVRASGRRRTVQFARTTFRRVPLGGGAQRLTIAKSARGLLRRNRRLTVWSYAHARGASGQTVTVKRKLTLVDG
jgi:hypothetical protein